MVAFTLHLCFFFPIFFMQAFAQRNFKSVCSPSQGNYTSNSTYHNNLKTLLSALPSDPQSEQSGFYNLSTSQTSDRVNLILLCRGDVIHDACRTCFNESAIKLADACPNQKEAIAWSDYCMLRYSNRTISGRSETTPSLDLFGGENVSNLTLFRGVLNSLIGSLRSKAAAGGTLRRFAVGEVDYPDYQYIYRAIYGLAQCTPDITELECNDCLEEATTEIPMNSDATFGRRILKPSCNVRYEVFRFYEVLANVDAPPPSLPPTARKRSNRARTVIFIVVPVIIFLIIVIITCITLQRKTRKKRFAKNDEITLTESLQFDLATIMSATNNFSNANHLGEGGFGSVYKGMLPNGQEIAVKRLAKNSGQGELEFKNEIALVAKLQHRNLVRILGFCLERDERLLIYEFIPNRSLDHFIFDPIKRENLDWEKRYKIIRDITRGLLYLHEDSRLRIIHRDLKASNVLLDEEMNAKLADFGMARLFPGDQTHGATNRVVGTYGYMAPEYAMHGQFSAKSDIFSYGIVILEIISGQKNNQWHNEDEIQHLLSYAWKNWNEGTALSIVDPKLVGGSRDEIMRCIHVGLLCAQENVLHRPTMASVDLMLSSYSLTIPLPSRPAFLMHNNANIDMVQQENNSRGTDSKQSNGRTADWSNNNVTITQLESR